MTTAHNAPQLPEHTPAPSAPTIFLGGLFFIAVLTVCNLAAEIILPIVLAFTLKLVFQPIMRILGHAKVPQGLAALAIILGLFAALIGLGAALSVPASDWAQRLPIILPQLQEKFKKIQTPLNAAQGLLHKAENVTNVSSTATPAGNTTTVIVQSNQDTFLGKLFQGTRNFASGLFETLLILFFLLMSGDTFLRRLVEVLPTFQQKKQAVGISQQIENDISRYLATITFMNFIVGLLTVLIMLITNTGDALLWGTLAFLLNYIPILGPLANLVILAAVEFSTKATLSEALLPLGLYFAVHLLEGQVATPMLLAKRFTLNPVLVVLALVFWYWMWGIPGAILATPLLVITKIIFDRNDTLKPFGHFMES